LGGGAWDLVPGNAGEGRGACVLWGQGNGGEGRGWAPAGAGWGWGWGSNVIHVGKTHGLESMGGWRWGVGGISTAAR
jgi:hypothetical protein